MGGSGGSPSFSWLAPGSLGQGSGDAAVYEACAGRCLPWSFGLRPLQPLHALPGQGDCHQSEWRARRGSKTHGAPPGFSHSLFAWGPETPLQVTEGFGLACSLLASSLEGGNRYHGFCG